MRRLVLLLGVLVLVAGATAVYSYNHARKTPVGYTLARVERGPLVATVSATGTLSAVATVQVGSQVSGQVRELYVDFNSPVKKGQLIALIDPDIFQAKVRQAQAELDSAQAAVLNNQAQLERARADVDNARAALAVAKAQTAKAQVVVTDAKRELGRKTELHRRELIAHAERDAAQVAHDSALAQLDATLAQEQAQVSMVNAAAAQLKVAEAQIQSAMAQVQQREAFLEQARVDLERTKIVSPVDGVVVSRNVDIGQTVAATLQAPTLFTIARDLSRMQVDTSVDEADIGRISTGQSATFVVDSFPRRTFSGTVGQVRKGAQVVHNVVTYNVVISVQNPDLKLLPGMTANVKIVVEQKAQVLKIPSAALRFRPAGVEPEAPAGSPPSSPAGVAGRVWVLGDSGKPRPVAVQVGISDGTFVELVKGSLNEGEELIVGAPESGAPGSSGGGLRLRF
jgi:HlyD family secretion protein